VTDASDGELLNRGYSYWSQAFVQGDDVLCFVGHRDGAPRFFRVNLRSRSVERLGPLLGLLGTGEGMYFGADGWVSRTVGPRLVRMNPLTSESRVVFDISECADYQNHRIWQAHSSDDRLTHSATIQEIMDVGPYLNIGTIAVRLGQQSVFFPAHGSLDESQITSDGAFLVIKENEDNVIIDMSDGSSARITDANGAFGHSDCGPSFIIGETDKPDPGRCAMLDFRTGERRDLFFTTRMGHVSVRAGRCLLSDETHLSLVVLDGSGITPILAHGMISDGTYDTQVFGNLDPAGRVAAYVSNAAGRFDLYLAELP